MFLMLLINLVLNKILQEHMCEMETLFEIFIKYNEEPCLQ